MPDFSRPYCSLLDIIDDLETDGRKNIGQAMRFIRAASQVIDKRGKFVPVTATRTFTGRLESTLWIDPLLSVSAFTYAGAALDVNDYALLPHNRLWENGPHTSIELATLGIWADYPYGNVAITGQWGLYDGALDLGLSVTQDINATTMSFPTADLISPGCIVRLDGEQEVIEDYAAPSVLNTNLLTADITDSQEDFNITDGSALSIGEIIRFNHEQLRVRDISSNSISTVRGWNSTARAAHDLNTAVEVYRTFNVTRQVNGTAIADHNAAAAERVLPPYDVRYLAEQISALMLKKGQAGFAGKTGNAELGEVFYHNEFPKDPIAEIMRGYRIVSI